MDVSEDIRMWSSRARPRTEVPADGTWPTRECTPWCDSPQTGHTDMHPDDRSCWSEHLFIPLSLAHPTKVGDRWTVDWMDVFLRRPPEEDDGCIVLFCSTADYEFRVTASEAELLSERLRDLAEVLRGKRDFEDLP